MKNKINDIIKSSMKNGDKDKLNLFRVLKGEISRLEDGKKELTEQETIKVIQKFVKNLETVGDEKSKSEIEMLQPFLPQLMSEPEIEDIIKMLIVTHNFCDMKDMGKLMGQFNKEYGGRADNKVVSQIVKNILK
tara:strand:- start:10348 stop:10749 length:402 start_codon:yes stop_codon:yes gene_type:complete